MPLATTTAGSPSNHLLIEYSAEYEVRRNGKTMAKQTTSLTQTGNNQYQLKDHTKGTHGMASFTGFQRTENSQFTVNKQEWHVQQHQMKQKVTLSKRHFSFTQNHDQPFIEGVHKKESFQIKQFDKQPISSHMLPLRIAYLACHQGVDSFQIDVLKSKKISHYHFTTSSSDGLIKVSRLYPQSKNKSSHIWLDPNRHCLTIKTQYTEGDTKVETHLSKSF